MYAKFNIASGNPCPCTFDPSIYTPSQMFENTRTICDNVKPDSYLKIEADDSRFVQILVITDTDEDGDLTEEYQEVGMGIQDALECGDNPEKIREDLIGDGWEPGSADRLIAEMIDVIGWKPNNTVQPPVYADNFRFTRGSMESFLGMDYDPTNPIKPAVHIHLPGYDLIQDQEDFHRSCAFINEADKSYLGNIIRDMVA